MVHNYRDYEEIKIVILGAKSVGKSALVYQYISHVFPDFEVDVDDSYRKQICKSQLRNPYPTTTTTTSPTTSASNGNNQVKEPLLIDILDTTANEEYSAMWDRSYRSGNAFVIVFSITNRESFNALEEKVEQILRVKDTDSDNAPPMIFVANKCDLENERAVSVEEGYNFAKKYHSVYIETSAKARINVDEAFSDLIRTTLNDKQYYDNVNYRRRMMRRAYKQRKFLFFKTKPPMQHAEMPETVYKVPLARFYNEYVDHSEIVVPESTYVADMSEMYSSMHFPDVWFCPTPITPPTSDDSHGDLIPAHKFVVLTRCPALRALVENAEQQNSNGKSADKFIVSVPFQASTLNAFLFYCYTGTLPATLLPSSPQPPPPPPPPPPPVDEIQQQQPQREEASLLLDLSKAWQLPDLETLVLQRYPSLSAPLPSDSAASSASATSSEDNNSNGKVKAVTAAESALPKLNRDMRRALMASSSDYKWFDVQFIIPDNNDKSASSGKQPSNTPKVICANKAILLHRSPYFSALFTGATKERTAKEVEIKEIDHLVMLFILEYCYTDEIRFLNEELIAEVLVAANRFCLTRLKRKLAKSIAAAVSVENVAEIYKLACDSDTDQLKNYCSIFIARLLKTVKSTCGNKFHSLFTQEDIDHFTSIRNKFPGADDYEQQWIEEQKRQQLKEQAKGEADADHDDSSPHHQGKGNVM